MIRFTCPACGVNYTMPPTSAGQTGICKCGQKLQVPGVPAVPAKEPEPKVRCHQCGKMVPVSEAVRQERPTGSFSVSTTPLGTGQPPVYGFGSNRAVVDVCRGCVKENERKSARQWAAWRRATPILILLSCLAVGWLVVCVVAFIFFVSR